MLPSVKKPKRIGGAPFGSPTRNKAVHSARDVGHAATIGAGGAGLLRRPGQNQQPHSARAGRAIVSSGLNSNVEGVASKPRGRSADGDRLRTPCTFKAEQYVKQMIGADREDAARDWALVQELDAMDYFAKESDKKKTERQKRVHNVSELHEQREGKEREKEKLDQERRKWRQEAEEDVVQYKKELEEKKMSKLEIQKRFNEDRRTFLELANAKKRQAHEEDRQADRDMAAAAAASQRKEEAADEKKKMVRKERATEMMSNAKQAREHKAQVIIQEAQNAVVLAKKQSDMLDKQERDRAGAKDALRAKQEAMLAAYEAGVGGELERKSKEDEERAQKQAQDKVEKEHLVQEHKELRLRSMKEAGKVAVAQQLRDHEAAKVRKQVEEQVYADQLKKQVLQSEAKEQEKVRVRKQAQSENAEFLRKQIKEREERASLQPIKKDQMDEAERKLNHEMLARAKDPHRADGLQLLLKKKRMEYRIAKEY